MRLTSLGPANDKPLLIEGAHLQGGNLSHAAVHESPSVSTQTLLVRAGAEFLSDVTVDGTLTVYGTVVGSGPYVDSSDARLKRNVTKVTGALEAVVQLQAVRYHYRTDEYPTRGLPDSLQMGWLAQDVQGVVPELVQEDGDGYLGVSYAHAAVLVAEAVKEQGGQQQRELEELRGEVAALREAVRALLAVKAEV
ncbi:hypothetical protein B484DRAFT_221254 [Ochromonadaceae sp. CCMP2298]|nr:hypothetical protein B484DRAFT_221254 [Ochromonadaceae sp. CCMP2298]